ncbi:DUF1236 domain-containing protein [Paracoccus sp. PARArs4]|uniref:DUF1236 domain-containing protein n=1 Tax=Paracoccus sp. PARArs4 TaxID=2853442 RepID=UPI0024A6FE7F|nr:DUF1236 domain-containing protein [Paracoccus sp. PARArs4]
MMTKIMTTSAVALLGLSGAAFAQATTATAATDLNVRQGPGVQHEVIGSIPAGDEVNVVGCIDSANWCEVNSDTIDGWAYGDYLNVTAGDEIVSLYPNRQDIGVTVIEAPAQPDNSGQNTAVGGVGGAAMGALIGGPVGAVAGAAIGGGAGAAASVEPEAEVTTYVTSNSVDPVYLEGEVVVGAGVPETVNIYDIPEAPEYRYAQINGQTVLVDPNDRQIVYIYR